jgi:hypothetical protein
LDLSECRHEVLQPRGSLSYDWLTVLSLLREHLVLQLPRLALYSASPLPVWLQGQIGPILVEGTAIPALPVIELGQPKVGLCLLGI